MSVFEKKANRFCHTALLIGAFAAQSVYAQASSDQAYEIFVTNERSDNLTVIEGGSWEVAATIPVGKRPRGIHASPDASTLYVALSGTPIQGPSGFDADGNPVYADDDDEVESDKSADGVGIVDVAQKKLIGKISVGSDPEEFDLSHDGTRLYVSNEDIAAASVLNIASGKVEQIIPVGDEPEGVITTPDGNAFYVTGEANGKITVIDTTTYQVISSFSVKPRPRTMDFIPEKNLGFIPSESYGLLNIIDIANHKVIDSISLPEGVRPMGVKVSPDRQKIYLSGGRSGTITVLDANSYEVLNSIKVGTRPWGIELSHDGKYLFSANGPSNDVSVVDLETEQEVARVPAGSSPWSLYVVPVSR